MPGLLLPSGDIDGAIVEFLREHRINALVLTQYDEPPIYIQKFQMLVWVKGQALVVRRLTDEQHPPEDQDLVARINLADNDSLDQLLCAIRKK